MQGQHIAEAHAEGLSRPRHLSEIHRKVRGQQAAEGATELGPRHGRGTAWDNRGSSRLEGFTWPRGRHSRASLQSHRSAGLDRHYHEWMGVELQDLIVATPGQSEQVSQLRCMAGGQAGSPSHQTVRATVSNIVRGSSGQRWSGVTASRRAAA